MLHLKILYTGRWIPNNNTSPHLESTVLNCMIIYKMADTDRNIETTNLILTGDIKPFVMEISPFGNCNFRGHSFADGTYLALIKKRLLYFAKKQFGKQCEYTNYEHHPSSHKMDGCLNSNKKEKKKLSYIICAKKLLHLIALFVF